MNDVAVIEVGRDAVVVALALSAPLMLVGMAVGLVIALFQALTTIQEITLTFVPKIIVIFVAFVACLPFMTTTLVEFGQRMFERIAVMG
jgi:flagellar biosynthetic protein FliQ